jgi:vacuolar-type H+-ATPase subunit H
MPILNSIKIAEEQAETLRREAEAKVRLLLEENRIATEMAVQSQNAAAEKARVDAEKQTLSEIDNLREKVQKDTGKKAESLSSSAKKKTEEVSRFLVDKALGS